MDLRRYLRALRRRAWVPTLLVVATAASAAALAFTSKPQYLATATVQARVTSSGGSTAPTQTLSLQEVVASHTLAIAVIKELGLTLSPSELSQHLRVTTGHSDLYTIAFTDASPDLAVGVANAVAAEAVRIYQQENAVANTAAFDVEVASRRQAFLQGFDAAERALLKFEAAHPDAARSPDIDVQTSYQELLLGQQAAATAYQSFVSNTTNSMVSSISEATHFTADVLDPAAATPDLGSRYLKVAYAAALALLLGLALVFILESADNTIREPGGVEEMIGLPVVGVIPLASPQTLRQFRGRSG